MEQAGHECVGFCEIDKFARESYKAIHNTTGEIEWHDITSVTNDDFRRLRGTVDIICGGFPCQAFSIAGKREGFADKTRGTLFFEIARAANEIRPQYLFLENVKGLLNHDSGETFRTILQTLDELGYDVEWQLCNSKYFGVPQNRERVFIIGHLRTGSRRKVFPIGTSNGEIVKLQGQQVYANTLTTRIEAQGTGTYVAECKQHTQGLVIKEATKQGYAEAFPGDSVNLAVPNSQTRRGRVGKGIANTLDTSCNQGVVLSGLYTNASESFQKKPLKGLSRCLKANQHDAAITDGFKIRKLTPLECFRLQGFPDWAFERAAKVNSNSQLYKQAGNSVTVNVIYEIAKRLGE